MDGGIPNAGVRVFGDDDAVGEIRAAIQKRVGGDGDFPQVCLRHYNRLRGSVLYGLGSNRVLTQGSHCLCKETGELIRRGVEDRRDVFPVPPHAGGHRIVVSFDMVEDQRLSAVQLGGHAGELVDRVYRRGNMRQPSGLFHLLQAIF